MLSFLKIYCFLALLCISNISTAATTLKVEVADTKPKQNWGLMGRHTLGKNQGMLFVYRPPEILNFWMFNTYIDLSVAFIDENEIIQEIHLLKAYPEMMDPKRPVRHLDELNKYPYGDPVRRFFLRRRVISNKKCEYALEVNSGWFKQHHITVGQCMIWHPSTQTVSFE